MKKFKKSLSLLLVVLTLLGCALSLSGCGKDSGKDDEITTINYWFPVNNIPNDLRDVQDEINEMIQKELPVKIVLNAVGISDYESTMSLKIATGDQFDICWTSSWLNDYQTTARKHAYVSLTKEMLQKNAPTIYDTVKPEYWDAAKIDGDIYGVINMQILPRQAAVSIDSAKAAAAGFDIKTVKNYEDLEPFMEYCKTQGETDICTMFDVDQFYTYFNWETLGASSKIPGVVCADDDKLKVINQFESDDWKYIMNLGSSWYKKGYIKENILTSYTSLDKICVRFPTTYKPGIAAEEVMYTGRNFDVTGIGDQYMYSSWVLASMNAISRTSKKPELALKVLELLYTNKEIYNTLCFGIEGTHYEKESENRVKILDNSGYSVPTAGWMFGNQFNEWLREENEDGIWEETKQINDSAVYSSSYGFIFDPSSVKTEIANCTAVYDSYYLPLILGLYPDTEAAYGEFITKMNSAGAEKIVKEKQRQINEWKKSK